MRQQKMKLKSLKDSLNSSAIFVLSVYLCLLGQPSSVRAAEPLVKQRFAYGVISNAVTPLWIAKDQGFFRKYGVDADLVFIISGTATQAMLAGQVPFGLLAITHVANAVAAGGDLTMILGFLNTLDYLFVTQPSIKSAVQLKGRKVAIGTPSGLPGLMTYMVLDHFGLNPKKDDIVLLQIGSVPARMAALRAKSVEATSLPPELAQVIVNEHYHVLFDAAKESIPFQSTGLVISRKLMKTDPQFVENMAKALIEAVAFIHNPANKKTVEGTLAKYLKLDKPEMVEVTYESLLKALPRKPCPSPKGTALVLKLMAQYGLNPKAAQLGTEDVIDMSLCKKLDESGFMERLYQGR
jgi:ABC-type nitrate/sulfonate/bicarbonate transport system substrate-binding protein